MSQYKVVILEVDDGYVSGQEILQNDFNCGWLIERVDSSRDFISYILYKNEEIQKKK